MKVFYVVQGDLSEEVTMNFNSSATLQREWGGGLQMRESIDHLVVQTIAFDAVTSPLFKNVFYNLPLQLAFGVLKQVLIQMRDESAKGSEPRLRDLLDDVKNASPWVNWQGLHDIVERQHAHTRKGQLFGDKQCQQDIADIEAQLAACGVITTAYVS
jgi:hypothetical protein